jgi:hypothetical protein
MARRLAGIALVALGLGATAPGPALGADVISAPERCSPKIGCYFSAPSYSMLTGESPVVAMPPVLDFPHDVVSADKGADGRSLFESAQVGAGRSAIVEGAEYLSPGAYHFICSVHNFPTIYGTRMEADLVVLDAGTPPKPRPTIELELPRQSLAQVVERGILLVTARADQVAERVKIVARAQGRVVATRTGLTLMPGGTRSVRLRLRRGARGGLSDLSSAVVSLVGAARFGEPETLRGRLG